MSSSFPPSLSRPSLALPRPPSIFSVYLPPVFLSTNSPALSSPEAIFSPCASTASVNFFFALSRSPISLSFLCSHRQAGDHPLPQQSWQTCPHVKPPDRGRGRRHRIGQERAC